MTSLKRKPTARHAFIRRDCGFIAKAAERRAAGSDLNQHAAVLAAVKDEPPVAAEGAAILDGVDGSHPWPQWPGKLS